MHENKTINPPPQTHTHTYKPIHVLSGLSFRAPVFMSEVLILFLNFNHLASFLNNEPTDECSSLQDAYVLNLQTLVHLLEAGISAAGSYWKSFHVSPTRQFPSIE